MNIKKLKTYFFSLSFIVKYRVIVLVIAILPTLGLASMSKQVGDYKIIFSVIPSILFMEHPANHPVRKMHGGITGLPKYHLMLTIFDTKTGNRINSATVVASIRFRSGRSYKKPLQTMLLNGAINYGHYFLLNSGPVKIHFSIKITGKSSPLDVNFDWSET